MLSFTKRVIIAVLSAIVFWTIIIMLFEDKFIFFPSTYPSGPYQDIRGIPSAVEHTFGTTDGVKLHGVYVPTDSAVATIIFSHGNVGNLSHRLHWLIRMRPLRANIFVYDYRGYGKSEGSPSESGIYLDAQAAYDHVTSIPGATAAPVVFWGRSLGGAVAVDLATNRNADGLILESTYTSAPDVAASAYPFLPFLKYMIGTRMDSRSKLSGLRVPSLHIHGDGDDIIPIELGTRLFDAARGPKTMYVIPGAGHNDTYMVGGEEYVGRVLAFLRSLSISPNSS